MMMIKIKSKSKCRASYCPARGERGEKVPNLLSFSHDQATSILTSIPTHSVLLLGIAQESNASEGPKRRVLILRTL